VSLDAFLFKAFKFFDLLNNGALSKNDFFRAIAKCGVLVESYVPFDLSRIWISFTIITNLKMGSFTIKISYSNCFLGKKKSNPIIQVVIKLV